MNRSFGPGYADQYDLLYKEKDYGAECELLEGVFRRLATGPVQSVLDLGCGTGGHAILLARQGYQVAGVDFSAQMLSEARTKAAQAGVNVAWVEGNIQTIRLGSLFDAAILMFAVLGYQLTNDEVLAVLSNVHRHLRPGGLLVFDVWYGPAVLNIGPGDRIKVIEDDHGQLIRAAASQLDSRNHLCNVNYRIWRMADNQLVAQCQEFHRMRFFFPKELELFLTSTGFELTLLSAFPEIDQPPHEKSWNALYVARKI